MPAALCRFILLGCLFGAAPLAAESAWQADAFGLYRSGSDPARDRWAGLRTGESGVLQEPGAVAVLHFIAGPKSVPAGRERVHLVALGFDADGNLVADGTEIRIAPGQGGRVHRTSLGGIADLLHDPGIVATGFVAGAETDAVQSLRATYRVTADIGSIRPAIAPQAPVLAETQAHIRLPALVDRHGNPAEDGTGLTVWLTDGRGRGARLDGEIAAGAAAAPLLVRDMTGRLVARAHLGNVASAERVIDSVPLQPEGPPPVRVEQLPEIGAQRLIVGPFRTAAGHLLADGVAVRLTVTAAGSAPRLHDTWVRDGLAEAVLPWPPGQPLSVVVESPLGRTETALPAIRSGETRP